MPFLDRESYANVQGLGSLAMARLEKKVGAVPLATLSQIRAALAFALELDVD